MAHLSLDEQRNVLERATKELKNLTEVDVKGFRMPEGEMNLDTYRALKSLGYRYSSSLSDDDIPYIEKTQEFWNFRFIGNYLIFLILHLHLIPRFLRGRHDRLEWMMYWKTGFMSWRVQGGGGLF